VDVEAQSEEDAVESAVELFLNESTDCVEKHDFAVGDVTRRAVVNEQEDDTDGGLHEEVTEGQELPCEQTPEASTGDGSVEVTLSDGSVGDVPAS
jgi:hypothetical protein